jgi:predicted membrane channel-forming protein YqfA (hemolysin III family)
VAIAATKQAIDKICVFTVCVFTVCVFTVCVFWFVLHGGVQCSSGHATVPIKPIPAQSAIGLLGKNMCFLHFHRFWHGHVSGTDQN